MRWGAAAVAALVISTLLGGVVAKIHHLRIRNDRRASFDLSIFDYVVGGELDVQLGNLTVEASDVVGFTLSRGDELDERLRSTPADCPLQSRRGSVGAALNVVYFLLELDPSAPAVRVRKEGAGVALLPVCADRQCIDDARLAWQADHRPVAAKVRKKRDEATDEVKEMFSDDPTVGGAAELTKKLPLHFDGQHYSMRFLTTILGEEQEGSYTLMFHNCFNYGTAFRKRMRVSFQLDMTERNGDSYLRAKDRPLPLMYFCLSVLFFLTGVLWLHLVRSSRPPNVFKIHYLMALLVFLKAASLFFHGVDFYFIDVYGRQQEFWAVIYYVMHLLKGALLFGTIILIGTGWTFFKNFLTENDRKLFMIVIPLQVIDNVALIIIEESEQGWKDYDFWAKLFIFIDLFCCAAVILPVIWSIRHLHEASQTDGKAAFNLEKLKVFRHFYVLIICYIYLTRILRYLVAFTVSFKYSWLVTLVVEGGTWLFFVVSGYEFRPVDNNPYLHLAQSDDDHAPQPLTKSGLTEGVTRVKRMPVEYHSDAEATASLLTDETAAESRPFDQAGPEFL